MCTDETGQKLEGRTVEASHAEHPLPTKVEPIGETFIESLNKTVQAIVLDLSSDPIFCFDRTGTYLYVNNAFARPFQKKPNEIIGRRIWDIFPGAAGDQRFSAVKSAFETGLQGELEVRVETQPVSWYLTTVTPIKDTHEAVQVVICISKNITQRKKLEQDLYDRSIRDGLTNLFNRQFIMEKLHELLAAEDFPKPAFSMMMLDIDHFKTINDQNGHVVGDEVLLELAARLKESFPNSGWVGRYGGDEFAVLLPDCGLSSAVHQAESLRRIIEAHRLTHIHLPLTISIGVAEFSDAGIRNFMERLDGLLYRAKREGRNRVIG